MLIHVTQDTFLYYSNIFKQKHSTVILLWVTTATDVLKDSLWHMFTTELQIPCEYKTSSQCHPPIIIFSSDLFHYAVLSPAPVRPHSSSFFSDSTLCSTLHTQTHLLSLFPVWKLYPRRRRGDCDSPVFKPTNPICCWNGSRRAEPGANQ